MLSVHDTIQADRKTRLKVKGEVHTEFVREGKVFEFSGLVVAELDCATLGAMPFLSRNDISQRS